MTYFTVFQDDSCFRGTFKSILEDANCSGAIRDNIIKDVEKHTTNNITLYLDFFNKSIHLHVYFHVEEIVLNPKEYFFRIPHVDNVKTFGVLLWAGDYDNKWQHSTRLCIKDPKNVVLMEPSSGKFLMIDHTKLVEKLSPKGFVFYKLTIK